MRLSKRVLILRFQIETQLCQLTEGQLPAMLEIIEQSKCYAILDLLNSRKGDDVTIGKDARLRRFFLMWGKLSLDEQVKIRTIALSRRATMPGEIIEFLDSLSFSAWSDTNGEDTGDDDVSSGVPR